MSADGPVVVFVGPTLPLVDCRALIGADFRPPAAQGDVYRAVAEARPAAIALVDGVFQTEPAVRHKELLWAIHCGVPVWGAASMGALRAAELAPCGMRGVGRIYRWYRRFPMTPDDAVAVAQAPAELGSRPLSVALVDLAVTFRAARRAGTIGRSDERRLLRAAAALHYKDRTLAAAVDRAAADFGLAPAAADEVRSGATLIELKRQDATHLLFLLAKRVDVADRARYSDGRKFAMTDAWMVDLQRSGQPLPATADSDVPIRF